MLELLVCLKNARECFLKSFPSAVTVGWFQISSWMYYGKLGQSFLFVSQVHACWGFMLENTEIYNRNLNHHTQKHIPEKNACTFWDQIISAFHIYSMYATEPNDCNILMSSTLTFNLEHFMFLRSWNKIISCKFLLDFDISLYFYTLI